MARRAVYFVFVVSTVVVIHSSTCLWSVDAAVGAAFGAEGLFGWRPDAAAGHDSHNSLNANNNNNKAEKTSPQAARGAFVDTFAEMNSDLVGIAGGHRFGGAVPLTEDVLEALVRKAEHEKRQTEYVKHHHAMDLKVQKILARRGQVPMLSRMEQRALREAKILHHGNTADGVPHVELVGPSVQQGEGIGDADAGRGGGRQLLQLGDDVPAAERSDGDSAKGSSLSGAGGHNSANVAVAPKEDEQSLPGSGDGGGGSGTLGTNNAEKTEPSWLSQSELERRNKQVAAGNAEAMEAGVAMLKGRKRKNEFRRAQRSAGHDNGPPSSAADAEHVSSHHQNRRGRGGEAWAGGEAASPRNRGGRARGGDHPDNHPGSETPDGLFSDHGHAAGRRYGNRQHFARSRRLGRLHPFRNASLSVRLRENPDYSGGDLGSKRVQSDDGVGGPIGGDGSKMLRRNSGLAMRRRKRAFSLTRACYDDVRAFCKPPYFVFHPRVEACLTANRDALSPICHDWHSARLVCFRDLKAGDVCQDPGKSRLGCIQERSNRHLLSEECRRSDFYKITSRETRLDTSNSNNNN